MDEMMTVILYTVIIFAVSLAGAVLPLLIKMNDRQTHLVIAFSAGIFLGVLCLMLLPEAFEETEHGGYDIITGMYAFLIGFLILFIADFLMKHYMKSDCDCEECMDFHSHDITSLSAFLGLAIHACFDGVALATSFIAGEEIGFAVLVALCVHKVVVVFSLSSTFLLSNRRKQAIKYLLLFCIISPLATLFTYFCLGDVEMEFTGLALMLSAGIFMFVTMCDIIPEAFHRKNLNVKSLGYLLLGLVVIIAVVILTDSLGGGHVH